MSRIETAFGDLLLAGALGCITATANTETVLNNFVAPPKGSVPYSGVIGGPAGELYGTTYSGGPANAGVVYKVDSAGETVLYNFKGGADGRVPSGGVIRDSAGNLYGTTEYGGGTAEAGVVFMLDPTGKETVLYSFTGGADGGLPVGGVVRDEAGNLYGEAASGGTGQVGVVFKVDPTGHETVLYSFKGGVDGSEPYGGLIRGSGGNIYGTTVFGGSAGYGTAYKLDAKGHETVLHSFGAADGTYPQSGLILDAAGNLYGTALYGGSGCKTAGCGLVFRLDPAGNETVLHNFSGPDGEFPGAGVIRDASGNLYGTTYEGGGKGFGVVYKLDPSGNESVAVQFRFGNNGLPAGRSDTRRGR